MASAKLKPSEELGSGGANAVACAAGLPVVAALVLIAAPAVACMHACLQMDACMPACLHACMHMHMHMHACMHACTCDLVLSPAGKRVSPAGKKVSPSSSPPPSPSPSPSKIG